MTFEVLAGVSTSSLIGVAIACMGNVLISLALTVQKLAHRRQNEELAASHSSSSSPSSPSETPHSPNRDDRSRSPTVTAVPIVMVPYSPNGEDSGETLVKLVEASPKDLSAMLTSESDEGEQRTKRSRSASLSTIRIPLIETNHSVKSPSPRSPVHEDIQKEVEEGAYLRSRLWWLGQALITLGEGGNFLSYGFAPASVVAPLGTVALVANCVFAPLILRERFHPRELIGMGLAILGAVTVVASSNASNPRLDPSGLVQAIKQPVFIVYTALNAVAIPLLILLSRSQRWGGRFIGVDVGICALFGGYTVLSTKALSSLLSTIFLGAFQQWISWILVAVLVGTSVMQIKYLNKALMRFQSKEVIPTQFVFFSIAAIIGSAVLYQEFRGVAFSRFVNFAFGIATTFLGVYLLTSFSQPDSDSDHESETSFLTATQPDDPHRATSSASLNLLLPSSAYERTPLLSATLDRRPTETPSTAHSVLGKVRLMKRTSTGDFTPNLGLSSQAGFLLMATTPPAGSAIANAMRWDRSVSRGQGDLMTIGRRTSYAGRSQ